MRLAHSRRCAGPEFSLENLLPISAAHPVDRRFEATLDGLGRFGRELVAARQTILQQQQDIEQLRLVASTALRAKKEAMAQVERAFHLVKDVRLRTAQAEDALNVERAERTRLSQELASITEQVGVLSGVLPMRTRSIAHNYQAMNESLVGIPKRPAT